MKEVVYPIISLIVCLGKKERGEEGKEIMKRELLLGEAHSGRRPVTPSLSVCTSGRDWEAEPINVLHSF